MDFNSIFAFILENPLPLPLWVKVLLMALDVGVLIWLVEKRKDKKSILLEITFIILALFIFLLLLNSIEQILDFAKSCEKFFADIDVNALLSAPIWHIFNAKTFIAILVFVALSTIALFFITRAILGRGVKLSKSFWEHKDIAQSKILWCNLLFFIMLFLIFLTAFSCFGLILCAFENSLDEHISAQSSIFSLCLALALVAVIFCAFIFQNLFLARHSIDKLARTLNATEITDLSKLNLQEKTLLNVITEMSLASNLPNPRVFIIKNEQGINAMCSGERFGKADEKIAIFVTQGALDTLSRDELQGVIGHEFSHAFHQDVALNLRIFALVFALSCVMVVGEVLLRAASNSSKRTSRSKNDGKGLAALVAIALVFFVLGYIGMLFAQIIQAAISRQKEFLADASSVQYTRNPQGIKSALQKIAQISSTYHASKDNENSPKKLTYLTNPKASSCAHMFFLPCCAMIFATHPPLEQRIAHLEQMGAKD